VRDVDGREKPSVSGVGGAVAEPCVIFLPGFMGSSLLYEGPGDLGQPVRAHIWGEKGADIVSALTRCSRSLRRHPELVHPGSVIRSITYLGLSVHVVYKKLLEFCTHTKVNGAYLKEGETFFPFAYDWRSSIADSAEKLNAYVDGIDPGGTREVRLVAHSMGGLVARVALATYPRLAQRTTVLFQIASPVDGSLKAFEALQSGLCLSEPWDTVIPWIYMGAKQAMEDFHGTVTSMPAIYELLPPESEHPLNDRTGKFRSAFEPEFWPQQAALSLASASKIHSLLDRAVPCSTVCVYSGTTWTPVVFHVDMDGHILEKDTKQCGDGTVVATSAIACSDLADRHLIGGRSTGHVELCSHAAVLALLKQHVMT
jgi:pimeloyl-ACP methyl ester carboxylesterase